MTWVKICGITNLEDGLRAAEAGADAVGFVFHEKSPRFVSSLAAQEIAARLPEKVEKVGVFADESWESIRKAAAKAGMTGIQFHNCGRQKGTEFFDLQGSKFYPVLRMSEFFNDRGGLQDFNWSRCDQHPQAGAIFLDSGTAQEPGGTGRTFDWEKAKPLADSIKLTGFRLVVAGGLTAANASEAIRTLEPWGVDISSGVEASPGKKDAVKIREFIAAVRELEKST